MSPLPSGFKNRQPQTLHHRAEFTRTHDVQGSAPSYELAPTTLIIKDADVVAAIGNDKVAWRCIAGGATTGHKANLSHVRDVDGLAALHEVVALHLVALRLGAVAQKLTVDAKGQRGKVGVVSIDNRTQRENRWPGIWRHWA